MATDIDDPGTRDLFTLPLQRAQNRRRQARYAGRQRQLGRHRCALWLTPAENARVKTLVTTLRRPGLKAKLLAWLLK